MRITICGSTIYVIRYATYGKLHKWSTEQVVQLNLGILHIPFFSNRPDYYPFIALLRPFVGGEDRVQGEAVLFDDIKDFSRHPGLILHDHIESVAPVSYPGDIHKHTEEILVGDDTYEFSLFNVRAGIRCYCRT